MRGIFELLFLTASALAQTLPTFPTPFAQSTAWNSSFKFSSGQIELGQLWPELAQNLETIINFDRSQLAHGGPSQDDFYKLGNISTPSRPGQILKVEDVTNPQVWNIPAKTALSRFIYTTTNVNGTLVPASAYILWPYTVKKLQTNSTGKAPVALWSHGTSGFFADGSPSAHRSLFYGNIMPFTLAQAGYAVVAADYAAQAHDSLNALRAARVAFGDNIINQYVNIGHSQGGAAAWGVSELLAEDTRDEWRDLERDYLGSVIFAPGIDTFSQGPQVFGPWIGKDLQLMYPDFQLSNWLTPLGIARTELLTQIQGGQYVSELLFLANATEMLNPAWNETWYASSFNSFTNPGNRKYKAPMILFSGTTDSGGLLYKGANATFASTCRDYYSGSFEFVTLPGVDHFPSMDSTRQQWLQWIEDRFDGRKIGSQQCTRSTLSSFLPGDAYPKDSTSFLQWAGQANEFYELVAGGF